MICGLSSGFAASGLVWAGLAAGERKKVLMVLDLWAARRRACLSQQPPPSRCTSGGAEDYI